MGFLLAPTRNLGAACSCAIRNASQVHDDKKSGQLLFLFYTEVCVTKLDVIVDLQYGDTGKGKVAHFLCTQNKYTHVIRYNGGANAGHTIYHKGVKFVTHQVPVGVFYGIRSII